MFIDCCKVAAELCCCKLIVHIISCQRREEKMCDLGHWSRSYRSLRHSAFAHLTSQLFAGNMVSTERKLPLGDFLLCFPRRRQQNSAKILNMRGTCGLCKQGSSLRRAENIIMWIYLVKITHISWWVWVTATPLNDGCSLRSLQQARSESPLTVMMLQMIICLGMYLRRSKNTCCLVMMVQSLSTSRCIKRANIFWMHGVGTDPERRFSCRTECVRKWWCVASSTAPLLWQVKAQRTCLSGGHSNNSW